MRKNAEKVLMAFAERKKANGQTIHTDGTTLYSYKMPIARINKDGGVDLVKYENAPSNTTRSHIRATEVFFGYGELNIIDNRVDSL